VRLKLCKTSNNIHKIDISLKLCKTSNNIHKIDISSQSVPQRRALNHEKYPTIQNWYLITIRPTKASS